jgi:iron complex outermembrane receptor protein
MRTYKLNSVTLAMLAMLSAGYAQAQQTSEVAKITVTGEGDKLGTGLIIDEDTPKAKSTVTKAQIDKTRASSNAFQDLNLLPGVNATSPDATGLFGGNLRVRGFNSDQMGVTVNGAPINDSGSFAVYPQELTDKENMCELFVTQGGTDTEAPHVGASGGNIGMNSCGPLDEARTRVAYSRGQLNYNRYFVRFDSGKIGDYKGFVSYSNSSVNKWRGSGDARRDHVDAGAEYDLGGGSKMSANLLFNESVNNNFRALSLADYAKYGYSKDYGTAIPQHSTATTTNESYASDSYYGYQINPFRNWLLTAKANLQLTPATRLDIEPYYWYGYGGAPYVTTLTEASSSWSSSSVHGGISDLNGDGTNGDKVLVLYGSVTETNRPGVNVKLSHIVDNHKIMGGLWLEQARHEQTGTATYVSNSGAISDIWMSNAANLVKYNDGSIYMGRNWRTLSTGKSVFAQDTIDLMDSKLQVTPAVSYRELKRDFTNFANSGTSNNDTSRADYRIIETYDQFLPSLSASYQVNDRLQAFTGLTQNFRAPSNTEYSALVKSSTISNGVATITSMYPVTVKPETSTNLDLGTRYRGDLFKASATLFYVDFQNRIANGYDPETASTHNYNVGSSTIKGVEFEAGTVPVAGFSAYATYSYTKSTIDENLQKSATTYYATAGKIFPDTPVNMMSASLQYASGPYMVNLAAKYTGKRYMTLVNDVELGGYTLVDLNAAWKLPIGAGWGFKNPLLRLNISNLLDRKYYLASLGSGSNIKVDSSSTTTVYSGAPRFASVTFQVDY